MAASRVGLPLLCLLFAARPVTCHALQYVGRIELGYGYADSSINVSVFRLSALVRLDDGRELVAFYDPGGYAQILVMAREGTVERRVRIEPRIEQRLLDDGHCVISIGLAHDGVLNILYGAHGTRPYYVAVSLRELLSTSTLTAEPWPFEMTYPQFYSIGNRLEAWFRVDPASDLARVRYDPSTRRLGTKFQTLLAAGGTSSVYMNQLAVNGRQLALSWMYRLPSSSDRVLNEGIYLLFSNDGGDTWTDHHGDPVELPASPGSISAALPVQLEARLLNQTPTAFDRQGRLWVTYYARDATGLYQIFVTRKTSNGWVTDQVTHNTEAFDLVGRGTLPLRLSRPQIAVSERFVHVIYRHGDAIVVASRSVTSTSGWREQRPPVEALGAWEPSYSAGAWLAERRLLVYVQAVRQGQSDTGVAGAPTPVSIYEFRED